MLGQIGLLYVGLMLLKIVIMLFYNKSVLKLDTTVFVSCFEIRFDTSNDT